VRRFLFSALAVPLGVTALAAQARPPLEARLDPSTLASVRSIIDSAGRDSVPSGVLEDKALEGAAKRVSPPRIVAAVRQLAADLRQTRALLRRAAPSAPLADGEIVAAAHARARGVPEAELTTLRNHVPAATPLVVAFTVLGDLVQRGVAADQALDVIEQLMGAGVGPEQVAGIPARMDVGLRLGAPPLDALRSALPIPVRPFRRPPTPPRPPRDLSHSHN